MKLIKYLEQETLSVSAFAKLIGRAHTTVGRIINGDTRPDWSTMEAIKKATNGAVTPNDFADAGKSSEAAA